jgi:hypothetical protein
VKGEERFVVAGDETEIAAILLCGLELEIAIVEAQEDGG